MSSYSYTIPTVDGTQVKYYAATSNNSNPGVLTASSEGFSIVTPTNSTGVYVLAYDASDSSDKKLIFVNKESSTGGTAPPVGETKGALYLKSTTSGASWEAFNTGILVSNSNASTVTSITAPSTAGDFVIHYDNNSGGYSFTSYTAVNINFPSGILVGKNSNTPDSITASKMGNYIIHYDGTTDYSLVETTSPIYSKGILVGDGSSTLKYMTGQADDFSSTQSNYYIIKATTTGINTEPSSYSLSVVPLNGLLYTDSNGINSVEIPASSGNYVLKYSNSSLSAVTLPTTAGIITYNAAKSVYNCINAVSGTYYLKGTKDDDSGNYSFVLEKAFVNNYNGINYAANGAQYIQNVMRFTQLENTTSSACYIIKASNAAIPDGGNTLTLNAQIINSGIMYGTDNHDINYASFPEYINANDQYVIKYNSNDQSIYLSSFTATATVSVPTSGILVGSANNVIDSIKASSNVDDTFVINFSKGSTGVNDGTYSLKSLNTLLPTITSSVGSPYILMNPTNSSTTSMTLTNEYYYCSTQVNIPTYALKTDGIQTRVDVEGIYRVNFDPTSLELTTDNRFSSSLTIPNSNSVNLMFILAFNPSNVHFGESTSNSTLANIGSWGNINDDDGYNFNTYLNTSYNYVFLTDGTKVTTSSQLSTTRNISVIPITNSPPFEYRYFKTSLYFNVNTLTKCENVSSSTPAVYIMYGYNKSNHVFNDGVSIANVNITVYSSTS